MYTIMYSIPGKEKSSILGFWLVAAPGELEGRVEKAQAMHGSNGEAVKATGCNRFEDFASALKHLEDVYERYGGELYKPHLNIAAVAFFGDPERYLTAIIDTLLEKEGYIDID